MAGRECTRVTALLLEMMVVRPVKEVLTARR